MPIQRRQFLCLAAATVAAAGVPALSHAATGEVMDAMTALKTRRSVRAYSAGHISQAQIDAMLEAAMQAPSARNEQPWEFVVIQNPETLAAIGAQHRNAAFAAKAPLAILVCLNERKEKIRGMGILDVSMCAQNLMLAAHALGLGSVFTGIYPNDGRMRAFRELCGLPEDIAPIGLIVVGHPERPERREATDRWNPAAIHAERWSGR